jgi:hypothetical protein
VYGDVITIRRRIPAFVRLPLKAAAATLLLFAGWELAPQSAEAHATPELRPHISFVGALNPVTVEWRGTIPCRSHRGLARNSGVSLMLRCDMLDRTAIGYLPRL